MNVDRNAPMDFTIDNLVSLFVLPTSVVVEVNAVQLVHIFAPFYSITPSILSVVCSSCTIVFE